MDPHKYLDIRESVARAGYAEEIDWSESVGPPASAEDFAAEAIYVICNSGMRAQVARRIYRRVMAVIKDGHPSSLAFGHEKKSQAIDLIWSNRGRLFEEYMAADDKVEFCGMLPWIGGITKWHLAKNFGVDVAKPDRHLVRIAESEGKSVDRLCQDLSEVTGDRVATVDLVLWRACNLGLIDSKGLEHGRAPVEKA